jgi:hypothetical protein
LPSECLRGLSERVSLETRYFDTLPDLLFILSYPLHFLVAE